MALDQQLHAGADPLGTPEFGPEAVAPRCMLALRDLLRDGAGPLYSPSAPGEVRRAAEAVLDSLVVPLAGRRAARS